jgi:hypothetical protein
VLTRAELPASVHRRKLFEDCHAVLCRAERKGKSFLVRIRSFRESSRAVARPAALEAERLAESLGARLQLEIS